MLPTVLPPNPSLEHLKKQAKDVLKSYHSGDVQVCTLLKKYLSRFAHLSDQEILADRLTLHDAQHVVALQYGFEKWPVLREVVQAQMARETSLSTLESLDGRMRLHIDALGFSTLSAYRIWCHKQGFERGLDKDDGQLQLEKERRLATLPEPVQDHRRGQAEKITRVYERVDTKGWLTNLFDGTEDETEREALYRLLIHIEKYSRVNWDAAAQLARYHRDWQNSVEKWFPKTEGRNRQLAELTQHLLGRDDVLLFRNTQFHRKDGPVARHQKVQRERGGGRVLSQEEMDSFEALGYLRVREAFPREAALKMQDFMWSELKWRHGFERDDPSTWTIKKWHPALWTALKLNRTSDNPVYKDIASDRLMGAYRDLLGAERAPYKQSWGAFQVVFPEQSDIPWEVGYDWDLSGMIRSDLNRLLGVYTFYSSVVHQGGGTLVVEGSHRLVMSFYDRMTPTDLKQSKQVHKNRFLESHSYFAELSGKVKDRSDRTRRFMEETTVIDDVPVRVVELTGEPGDAIFYHSALLRGASPNLSDVPRFVRG